MDNLELIRFKYEAGVYDLNMMCQLVEDHNITKEEFHDITTYNYEGVKEKGGKN